MNTPAGTVTRILNLNVEELTPDELQKSIEDLCARLFRGTQHKSSGAPATGLQDPEEAEGKQRPPSIYEKMCAFANMFCSGTWDEDVVADEMTRILVELYPEGKVRAKNSLQLEALLRTSIRNRLITVYRRESKQEPLVEEPATIAPTEIETDEPMDDQVAMHAFVSFLERDKKCEDKRDQLVSFAQLLYQSAGAQTSEDRQRIMQSFKISTATYFRWRTELKTRFVEFLDSGIG